MDGSKAVGIDGITKEEYGANLEENLNDLVRRLKQKAYKPKPARRVEIPKGNGKSRPLSIYCYEDKLVQEALRRVLEAVFEPHFYEEMMGFRPGRSCHMALRKLNGMLEKEKTNWVLDADIKGFFDHLDHEWIEKFIESRIKDPNIIRLIRRMLKAGIMKDYQYEETGEGSGQGGLCGAPHKFPCGVPRSGITVEPSGILIGAFRIRLIIKISCLSCIPNAHI